MENISMPQTFSRQDLITIISEFPTLAEADADTSEAAHKVQFPNCTLLGDGAYGEVYKGRLPNGMEVAVKVLKENRVTEKTFMAEVRIMFTATHKNIVKLYGFCFNDEIKALVYELMAGSLNMILFEKEPKIDNETNLPRSEWAKLFNITVGIAEGLSYLHDVCGIIHHDVKPSNVLLDFDGTPKLTDFGEAFHMDRNSSHRTGTALRGTSGFMAPEVVLRSRITYMCDVYSYGMMLFKVLSGKRNSGNGYPEHVWDKYKDGHLDKLLMDYGIKGDDIENARILTMVGFWCVQCKPEARPTMRTVINWLEKVIPVPKSCCPFFPVETATPSLPPTPDEMVTPVPEPCEAATSSLPPTPDGRMFMNWWPSLEKVVARMLSKDPPQELPSLQLYMEKLLKGPPKIIYNQLRMQRRVFFELCKLFRQREWLRDTEFAIEEKIAIFLMKMGPEFSYKFQISSQQRESCFGVVLVAMLKFSNEMIVSSNYDISIGNHCRHLRKGPFRGVVGALDGTLMYPPIMPGGRNNKDFCNVLGVCDFDMKFNYVLVFSGGVDHDSKLLDEALRHPRDKLPLPPQGKYYLYDSSYTASTGFLCPYRNTRYRLQDFLNGDRISNKEEAFNHAHAQLRNVIERAFGVLKARFIILNAVVPPQLNQNYGVVTQKKKNIVLACMAIHNFVRQKSRGDPLFQEWESDDNLLINRKQRVDPMKINDFAGEERDDMVNLREEITSQLIENDSYSYQL